MGNIATAEKQTVACIPTVFGGAFSSHAVNPQPDFMATRTQQKGGKLRSVLTESRGQRCLANSTVAKKYDLLTVVKYAVGMTRARTCVAAPLAVPHRCHTKGITKVFVPKISGTTQHP